ncbi:hypothetical protein [Nocardia sp. NBC_00403]|uniref:hypothetical protein n=1 Tax=Nocardia sp. NBC_00403 TaxID=2975990 RepID=UPI002E21442E
MTARFRLEAHTPIPGHGTLNTRLELPDLDDLIEHARLWVLQDQLHTQQIRIYDRSAELLAVDGTGGPHEDQALADDYSTTTGPDVTIARGYNMILRVCPTSPDHPHVQLMQ